MTGMDELSVAAEDHLKAIYKATEGSDRGVSTTELARLLGTTAASVSDMVKRLTARELVDHRPYKPVRLTPTGRAAAIRVVRRHRLVETFLVAELGYSWDEVHDEAEALEHWMSDRLVDSIDAKLGYPEVDPHGDPIPRPDGSVDDQTELVRLHDAPVGDYQVARLSDDSPEVLVYCADRGLTPGARIQVVDRDEVAGTLTVVVTGGRRVVMGAAVTTEIRVRSQAG